MKKTGTHPFPSQEGMVKLRVVGFYVLSCIAVLSLSKEYRLLPRSLVPHQFFAAKRSSTKDSRHPDRSVGVRSVILFSIEQLRLPRERSDSGRTLVRS